MVYKSQYTSETYRDGDTRIKRVFAWLPFRINGDMVWLETYEIYQRFTANTFTVNESDKAYLTTEWINLSYRIIQ